MAFGIDIISMLQAWCDHNPQPNPTQTTQSQRHSLGGFRDMRVPDIYQTWSWPTALASPCRDTARQLLFCYHLSTESIPSISRPSCTPTRPQNGNDKIKPQCLYLFVGFVVTQGWYHRVTQLCTVCLRDFNDVSRKFPQYLENSLNWALPSLKQPTNKCFNTLESIKTICYMGI